MQLHLINGYDTPLLVEVENSEVARKLFDQSLQHDPWIAAILTRDGNTFVDSFVRITQPEESHPLVPKSIIEQALKDRAQCREDWLFAERESKAWIPGLCHEVSECLQVEFGFARTSGTIMARDCVTPICLHYWNVLPDLSILDMTADQLMEGSDYRIIPKGHPDWYRYQPEFDDFEDVQDLLGEGVYSDDLINFIVQTGRRIQQLPHKSPGSFMSYLHAQPAGEELKSSLEPLITEYFQKCLAENVGEQAYLKRTRAPEVGGPEL